MLGISTCFNLTQFLYAFIPIVLHPRDHFTLSKLVQFQNKFIPVEVILSGNSTFFKDVHPLNTSASNLVTPYSNVISSRLVQLQKLSFFIVLTLAGIKISLRLLQSIKASSSIVVTLGGTSKLLIPDLSKRPSAIFVILSDKSTASRLVVPQNTFFPIDVTELVIVI